MKHSSRRILALLLALSLCIGMMPMSIFADDAKETPVEVLEQFAENVPADDTGMLDEETKEEPAAPAEGTTVLVDGQDKPVEQPIEQPEEEAAVEEQKVDEVVAEPVAEEEQKVDEVKTEPVEEEQKAEAVEDDEVTAESEAENATPVETAAKAMTMLKAGSSEPLEYLDQFVLNYPGEELTVYATSHHWGYPVGSYITRPSKDPVREGYTFLYWSYYDHGKAGNKRSEIDFDTDRVMDPRGRYYYAIWAKDEDVITVTYDFGEGFEPITKKVAKGEVVFYPNAPTPNGNYIFEGWLNEDGELFNEKKFEESMTLTAIRVTACEVTFDSNGGTPDNSADLEPRLVAEGKPLGQLPAVHKDGYQLVGWYYLENGEEVFVNEDTIVSSDLDLTSKWVKVSEVKFYSNYTETMQLFNRSAMLSVDTEKAYLAPAPGEKGIGFITPFGYEFLGWKETDTDPNPDTYIPPQKSPQFRSPAKAMDTKDAADEAEKLFDYAVGEEVLEVKDHDRVYLSAVWGECNTVIYRSMYPLDGGLEDAPYCRVPYKNGEETFRVANYKDDPVNFERPVGYEFAGWERTVIDTEEEYNDFFGVETLPVGPGEGTIVKKAAEMARSETRSEASTSEAVVQLKDIVQPYEKTNKEEDLHVVVVLDALWKKAPLVTYHTNYPIDRKGGLPEDNKVSIDPYEGLTDDQDRPEEFVILALDDEELQFAVPDGYEFDGWYIEYNMGKEVKPFNPGDVLPARPSNPSEQLVEQAQQLDATEYSKETLKRAAVRDTSAEEAQPGQGGLQEKEIEKESSGRSDKLYQPDETFTIYTRVDVYAIWLVKPTVVYHTAYDRNRIEGLEEADYKDPKDYSAKDNPLYSGKDDKDKEKLEVLDFYDIGTERGFVDPDGYVFDYWIMEFRQIGPAANSPVNFFISAAEDELPGDIEEYEEAEAEYDEAEEDYEDNVEEVAVRAIEAKTEKRETVVMKAAKASVPEEAVKESIKDATVFPAEAAEAAETAESAVAIAAEEKEDPPLVSPDKIKPGDKEDINLFVDFYAVYAPVYVVEYNSNYPEELSLDVQTARDKIKSSKEDVIYNVLSLDEVTEINSDFVAPVGYKFRGWSLDDPDQTEKLMNAPEDTITFPGVKPADETPTDEQPSTNGKEPVNPGSVKPIDWNNLPTSIDTQTLPSADVSQAGGSSEASEKRAELLSELVKAEAKESDEAEQAAVLDEKAEDAEEPGTIPPEQDGGDPQPDATGTKPAHILYAQWEKVYGVYWIDKDGSTDDPLATGTYDTYDPEAFNPADEYNEKKTDDAPTTDKLTYTDEDGVTYVFDHWERIKYDEETKTVVYEAAYRPVDSEKTYTITWVDGDGNVLKTDTVKEGETPNYTGDTPTKSPNGDTTYTFNDKWSPDIVPATEDKTYTAQFDENTPNNPTTPSNPRPNTPATTEDPVEEEPSEIDENDTPLAGFEVDPEEDEPVAENDTPLAGYEEEPDEELSDEAMPFSPFTGDARHTAVWSIISVLSLLGIVLVARKRREE